MGEQYHPRQVCQDKHPSEFPVIAMAVHAQQHSDAENIADRTGLAFSGAETWGTVIAQVRLRVWHIAVPNGGAYSLPRAL